MSNLNSCSLFSFKRNNDFSSLKICINCGLEPKYENILSKCNVMPPLVKTLICVFEEVIVALDSYNDIKIYMCKYCTCLSETNFARICGGVGSLYPVCTPSECIVTYKHGAVYVCKHNRQKWVLRVGSMCSLIDGSCKYCRVQVPVSIQVIIERYELSLLCLRNRRFLDLYDYDSFIKQNAISK